MREPGRQASVYFPGQNPAAFALAEGAPCAPNTSHTGNEKQLPSTTKSDGPAHDKSGMGSLQYSPESATDPCPRTSLTGEKNQSQRESDGPPHKRSEIGSFYSPEWAVHLEIGPLEGSDMGSLYSPQAVTRVLQPSDKTSEIKLNNVAGAMRWQELDSSNSARSSSARLSARGVRFWGASGDESPSAREDTKTDEDDEQTGTSRAGVVEATKGVAVEVGDTLVQLRDRVMERLAALQVPAEALEAARRSLEASLKEVYSTTRDAVERTKLRLLEILPSSLNPSHASEARQVVEDMEEEVLRKSEAAADASHSRVEGGASNEGRSNLAAVPTSTFFSSTLHSRL